MRPRCVRVFVCVKSFYHRNRCWPWFHFQIIFQSPNNKNLCIQQNMVVCIGEWKKKRACVQHTLEISSHSLFFSLLSPNRNALKSHHFHQNIAINETSPSDVCMNELNVWMNYEKFSPNFICRVVRQKGLIWEYPYCLVAGWLKVGLQNP